MQLIGSAEVHLAGKRSLIARTPQVVGEGGYLGGKLGSVVVGADFRRQLAGQERKARRRAQRAVAVEGFKDDSRIRERIDVRRARDRAAVRAKHPRRQLVGHEDQKVRAIRHARLALHHRQVTLRILSRRVGASHIGASSAWRRVSIHADRGGARVTLRQIPQSFLQGTEPRLEVSPLVQALLEDRLAHLLGARRTHAALRLIELHAFGFERKSAEVENSAHIAFEALDHVLVLHAQDLSGEHCVPCCISST